MICFELLMLYLLLILEIFSPVAAQRAYELYDEGILSHLSNLNPSILNSYQVFDYLLDWS